MKGDAFQTDRYRCHKASSLDEEVRQVDVGTRGVVDIIKPLRDLQGRPEMGQARIDVAHVSEVHAEGVEGMCFHVVRAHSSGNLY